MHKKALSVAIAGALAVPMATPIVAQAVDFTISGQINRALVVRDTDAATTATVEDNGESDTRIRASGSTELDNGATVAIQFEYGVGGSYDRNAGHSTAPIPRAGVTTPDDALGGTGVYLRHANVQYRGDFGAVTIGQGSEAGDGSQYAGDSGVWGLAHGSKTLYSNYFQSLDSGGRVNMLRYDTPALGPVAAAVSVGNGDRVSGRVSLTTAVAGSSFHARAGALMLDNRNDPLPDTSSFGVSFGADLASGFHVSGAWGKAKNWTGARDPATGKLVEEVPAHFRSVNVVKMYMLDSNVADNTVVEDATFDTHMASLRTRITDGEDGEDGETATQDQRDDAAAATKLMRELFVMAGAPTMDMGCNPAADEDVLLGQGLPLTPTDRDCGDRMYPATKKDDTRVDVVNHITDPSYVHMEIGYKFGNTAVSASWYQSSDFVVEGSSGTAIGAGAAHTFPKAGATVYAAVENYSVTPRQGATKLDGTLFMLGSIVSF